ncbi:MAG: exo-alpha-sialidase [Planctomycetes bacterium]|nr:exo-alpha-sialidase [Planctomycetota bacterium]
MSDRLHVSTRKGLFHFARRGTDWRIDRVSFLGVPVTLTEFDARDGTLYAALDHGHFGTKFQRSTDDGATWQEVAAPKYPEFPADEPEEKDLMGRPWPWSLKMVWSLAVDPRNPRALWCGTIPGGLFHSSDGGESWQINEALWSMPERKKWVGGGADLPGIHSVCVDPRNAERIAVGISCGGVWLTEDGGATWRSSAKGMRAEYMPPEQAYDEATQDPHMVVQCRAQPDCYWAQHHNGIFRSTDGCANWVELDDVKPSAFGFGVAVHPEDPDTAWFVPGVKDEMRIPVDGKLVVNRTRDGGKSFEQLTDGLPQEHAYDLVFRHALAIDATGDRLAFGSTTGSLWATDDQGEHWRLLSSHLPPVYAVRFAVE